MSNLINKAKDALSGNKHHDTTTANTTSSTYDHSGAGPHDAAIGNRADPTVDSRTGHQTTGNHGYGHGTTSNTTAGPHTTGNHDYGHSTTSNNAAGPHSSNFANKLDPRVDSDADHRNNPTSRVGGYGDSQGTYGSSGYGTNSTTTAGPHSSNMANKVDPRFDSDADHRNNPTSHVGGYGDTQGTHGNSGYGTSTATTTGAHSSSMANKLDPRVDSDADHRRNPTSRVGGYGETQGTHGTHDTYGTHDTHGGSGLTSTGPGYGASGHHTGATGGTAAHHATTTTTAGGSIEPGYGGATGFTESSRVHDSKLLNKLDPKTKTDSQGRAI